MISELLSKALMIIAVGMGVVFSFILLMIMAIQLNAKIIKALGKDKVEEYQDLGRDKNYDEAIKRLNEDDLRFLNRLIVERIKLIAQARATTLMTSFTRGDRVSFRVSDGRMLEGMVLRLNKKTVSVATDDGHQWNVAPGLLRLVQSAGDVQWP